MSWSALPVSDPVLVAKDAEKKNCPPGTESWLSKWEIRSGKNKHTCDLVLDNAVQQRSTSACQGKWEKGMNLSLDFATY